MALRIPPVTPQHVGIADLGDGEWRVTASHGGVGDGDRLIAYIRRTDADPPQYEVDPTPPDGCYTSRRRCQTLGQAKTIGRQMAREHLGFIEARQRQFRGCD